MLKKRKFKIFCFIVTIIFACTFSFSSGLVPGDASIKVQAAEAGGADITAVAYGDFYDMEDGTAPQTGSHIDLNPNPHGDTWAFTWAGDDGLYGETNDAKGFDGSTDFRNIIYKLEGNPNFNTPNIWGKNLNPSIYGNNRVYTKIVVRIPL